MHVKKQEALKREINILYDLYNFRVMSIEQLVKRSTYTLGTMYHKVSDLQKRGLILAGDIRGFTVEGGRRGRYYRISNKGITLLKEWGYDVTYTADDLRVSDYRVPILLETNDLFFDFSSQGWSIMDSRATKNVYELNRGDNLHGMITSPRHKKYPFYIFLNNTSDKHITRISREVNRYSFSDIILFVNSKAIFQKVFVEMLREADIFTYRSFRILPLGFGKRYLLHYDDEELLLDYLEDNYDLIVTSASKDKNSRDGFTTTVKYKGKKYYLVNMLDHNLSNIHHIHQYTNERYERSGKRLLLLTDGTVNYPEFLRGNTSFIDFLQIDNRSLMAYPNK